MKAITARAARAAARAAASIASQLNALAFQLDPVQGAQPSPTKLPVPSSPREAHKSRVVRLDEAIRCCERSGLKADQRSLRIVGDVLDSLIKPSNGAEALVLLTTPAAARAVGAEALTSTLPRIIRLVPGGPLTLGVLLLAGGDAVRRIAGNTAALETASLIASGLQKATNTKKTTTDCEECLEKKTLPQNSERSLTFKKYYARIQK